MTTTTKRQEVLCAVEKARESPQGFLDVIRKHENKTDPFDLLEFFQSLPKKQHEELWHLLNVITKATIEKLAATISEGILQVDNTLLRILSGVVSFARCAIDQDVPTVPKSFPETVQQLHDILLELSDLDGDLQNATSLLCEKWWCKDVGGKNELMPNTLSYLVARTLSPGAKQVDVKRLWAVRQAFLLLDFDDPSADMMKSMLMSCCVHPVYLRCDQGRKLISFMFGLHPAFVGNLHQAIKKVIPYCSRAHLKAYGEIYFRSWRFASGPYLKEIEDKCLQDLMYCAVHASRHGTKSLFNALRLLLSQFQLQRNHKGVTEMFTRLYKPFLWRSLRVANAYVRANAAALLLDAFPLSEPDLDKEEADELLQKQFDTMRDLLQDSSVAVRVTAILGVCKVVATYWEMIPAIVIKTFLQELVENLAWDTASVDVRVAVLQGLCMVLENRMSHHLMKRILPLIQPRIHDTSEKVRLAFLDLLLVVKGLGTIKFWSVCPVEHLLARMELDSVPVVKRIAALLMESFQPSEASRMKQLENCVALIEANPNAARRFYHLAVGHLSLESIVQFIENLLKVIVDYAKLDTKDIEECNEDGLLVPEGKEGQDCAEVAREGDVDAEEGTVNGKDELGLWTWTEEGDQSVNQEEMSSKLKNKAIITGLLETTVILWEGSKENLKLTKSKALRGRLVEAVGQSLPVLFERFRGEDSARSALYLLSSCLPKKYITFLTKDTLALLSSLTKGQEYGSLLVALISWGQRDQVVKIIGSKVAQGFDELKMADGKVHAAPVKNGGRKRGGPGKRSKSKEQSGGGGDSGLQAAVLALDMLEWLMAHPYCMEELKQTKQFWELSSVLIESLVHTAELSAQATPIFLTRAFVCYMKMEMHRLANSEDRSSPQAIDDIMDWCVATVVPQLKEIKTTPKAKRRAGEGNKDPDLRGDVAYEVVEMAMTLLGDMIMVGLTGTSTELKIAMFCDVVMGTGAGPSLLPTACKVFYQLVEVSSRCELEGIHSVGGLRPVAIVMKRILDVLHGMSLTTPDAFGKVWSQVRSCLVAAIVMGVRLHSLSLSSQEVPVFAVLVEEVVQATVDKLIENPEVSVPSHLEDLPLFVTNVLTQTCKSQLSADLFASHLGDHLSQLTQQPPESFCTHQASLHILLAMSKYGSGNELLRCVRPTLKMLQGLTAEQRESWDSMVKSLSSLCEHAQEVLSCV